MTVFLMRYVIETAGNVQALYNAVRTAADSPTTDLQRLLERYTLRKGVLNPDSLVRVGARRGRRSSEAHFSLARELDLLESKENGEWRVTSGAGKAFLLAWERFAHHPPTSFLLFQILRNDRTFLLPFLATLLQEDYDFSIKKSESAVEAAGVTWTKIWTEHGRELSRIEPPIPRLVKKRTLLHYASARIRLIGGNEGLSLDTCQIGRLVDEFRDSENSETLPPDSYAKIGKTLSGQFPSIADEQFTTAKIVELQPLLAKAGYASASGLFGLLNELGLPQTAFDRRTFDSVLRRAQRFSLHPSFKRDDMLVSVRSGPAVAETQDLKKARDQDSMVRWNLKK